MPNKRVFPKTIAEIKAGAKVFLIPFKEQPPVLYKYNGYDRGETFFYKSSKIHKGFFSYNSTMLCEATET